MAYIPYVSQEDASPELRELYERYRDPDGAIDNILRIHGLNPASLTGHVNFYQTLMRGRSDLTRTQREMIAMVVSAINECHY